MTTTDTEVTQEARERAAAYFDQQSKFQHADCIRAGDFDSSFLVQAFARHRTTRGCEPPTTGHHTMTEVVVTPDDRKSADKALDIAFRGDTTTIDADMAQLFARHRTLTPAQAAGPVLLEAAIEQVAELQLAAFLAGRGSVITKHRGSTMSAKPAPTMDDFRRMARAAITQAEGPQA